MKLDTTTMLGALAEWNFWDRDQETGIERDGYVARLLGLADSGQIVCVSGVRRCGKSFILRQTIKRLMETGVNRRRVIYANFEDVRLGVRTPQDMETMYQAAVAHLGAEGEPVWLFLDEVQEIVGWERWVRTAHELRKARVVVSGSNSQLLGREFGEKLTGRHADLVVYPLSLTEFVRFRKGASADMHLASYLTQGGFPLPVLEQEMASELLLTYFTDILHRDIAGRYHVRKEEELVDLAKFVVSNYAASVTYTSMAKFLHISTDSAKKYMRFLTEAYVVFPVERFSYKMKARGKSPQKVYCVDTGLANVVGLRANQNIGRLAENAVYVELMRRGKIVYYWKDELHREVDFVVWSSTEVEEVLQVCWDITHPKTRDREIRSLLRMCQEVGKDEATVLTADYQSDETVEGIRIRYRRLADWLV